MTSGRASSTSTGLVRTRQGLGLLRSRIEQKLASEDPTRMDLLNNVIKEQFEQFEMLLKACTKSMTGANAEQLGMMIGRDRTKLEELIRLVYPSTESTGGAAKARDNKNDPLKDMEQKILQHLALMELANNKDKYTDTLKNLETTWCSLFDISKVDYAKQLSLLKLDGKDLSEATITKVGKDLSRIAEIIYINAELLFELNKSLELFRHFKGKTEMFFQIMECFVLESKNSMLQQEVHIADNEVQEILACIDIFSRSGYSRCCPTLIHQARRVSAKPSAESASPSRGLQRSLPPSTKRATPC